MKPLTLLALIFVTLGLIIAAVPQNTTKPFRLNAETMLAEVSSGAHFMAPETVADMIINKDPSLSLIDIRNPDEFVKYSLPGAFNIPSPELLSEQYADVFDQNTRMNVLYSNSTVAATEAWMILRQLGYENIYVLEGGLNYWFDSIMNPQKPPSTSSNEELAKYDFRKSAGMALGGGGAVKADEAQGSLPAKPSIKIAPKKKKAAGGC